MHVVRTIRVLVLVSVIPCFIESSRQSCKRDINPSSRTHNQNVGSFSGRFKVDHGIDDKKIYDIIKQSILDTQISHDSFTNSNKTIYSRGNKQ